MLVDVHPYFYRVGVMLVDVHPYFYRVGVMLVDVHPFFKICLNCIKCI